MTATSIDQEVLKQRPNPLAGMWQGIVRSFRALSRNRAGFIGFLGLVFFFILTFVGPQLVTFDDEVNLDEIAGPPGSRIQLLVRQENATTYTSFESLAGRRVGVVSSTGGPSLIAPYEDTLEVETYRWNSRLAGPGLPAALHALDAGEIDAMLIFSKSVADFVSIPDSPEGRALLVEPLARFNLSNVRNLNPEDLRAMATGLTQIAATLSQFSPDQLGQLVPGDLVHIAGHLEELATEVEVLDAATLAQTNLANLTHLEANVMAQVAADIARLDREVLIQLDPEALTQIRLADLAQRVTFSDLVVSNPALGPPHLLGTDTQGRDIASHIVHGGAELITVALLAGAISTTIAVVLGSLAALFSGLLDQLLTALTNFILAIPRFPLLVVLAALLTLNSPLVLAVLIGVISWPSLMRSVRAQVLSLRERDYVEAAVALDLGTRHIMLREILPNMVSYVALHLIFSITYAMYEQIGLVVLGLAPINNYTWGVMIFFGRSRGTIFNPDGASMLVSPILAIALFQVFMIMFARAMEEMLDPRLRAGT